MAHRGGEDPVVQRARKVQVTRGAARNAAEGRLAQITSTMQDLGGALSNQQRAKFAEERAMLNTRLKEIGRELDVVNPIVQVAGPAPRRRR